MKTCTRCGGAVSTHAQLAQRAEAAIAFGGNRAEDVHERIGWMLGALRSLKSELLGVCWVCESRESLAGAKAWLAEMEAAR